MYDKDHDIYKLYAIRLKYHFYIQATIETTKWIFLAYVLFFICMDVFTNIFYEPSITSIVPSCI